VTGPTAVRETGTPDPDRALVDRVRRGDDEGCRLLVEKYERRVVALAWGLVGNRADAEDIAQDTFLRACRGLATFRGQSTFRSWLFQIAINAARTFRRTRVARHEDTTADGYDFDQSPAPGNLERAVIARDEVRRALAALPEDLRQAVVLRDVEGLDYREIAVALAVPIGTVESRIFRGRARLRRALIEAVPGGREVHQS
jgi:RNA polymerase sigma-70 factor (ECF subfamily)